MKPCLCLMALGLILGLGEGCMVRTAAETIIRLDGADFDGVYGLADTHFAEGASGIMAVGHGAHPREHETYCFFACEPSYAFMPRYIILRPMPNAEAASSYQVIFLLGRGEDPLARDDFLRFEGRTAPPRKLLFDRCQWRLNGVKVALRSDPTVVAELNGTVIARRDPQWATRQYDDLRLRGLSQKLEKLIKSDPRVEDATVALWPEGEQTPDGLLDAFYSIWISPSSNASQSQREIIRDILDKSGYALADVAPKYNQFNPDRLQGIIRVPAAELRLPGDSP